MRTETGVYFYKLCISSGMYFLYMDVHTHKEQDISNEKGV